MVMQTWVGEWTGPWMKRLPTMRLTSGECKHIALNIWSSWPLYTGICVVGTHWRLIGNVIHLQISCTVSKPTFLSWRSEQRIKEIKHKKDAPKQQSCLDTECCFTKTEQGLIVGLKVTLFGDVTPCNMIFSDVSEESPVIVRFGPFVSYVAYNNRGIVKNWEGRGSKQPFIDHYTALHQHSLSSWGKPYILNSLTKCTLQEHFAGSFAVLSLHTIIISYMFRPFLDHHPGDYR